MVPQTGALRLPSDYFAKLLAKKVNELRNISIMIEIDFSAASVAPRGGRACRGGATVRAAVRAAVAPPRTSALPDSPAGNAAKNPGLLLVAPHRATLSLDCEGARAAHAEG